MEERNCALETSAATSKRHSYMHFCDEITFVFFVNAVLHKLWNFDNVEDDIHTFRLTCGYVNIKKSLIT